MEPFRDTNGNGKWDQNERAHIDYLDCNNPTQLFEMPLNVGMHGRLEFTWFNGGANTPALANIQSAFAESAPEPATLSLLLAGIAATLRRRRAA